jgi:hypothetical protein
MTSFMIADCSTKNCGLQPATITVPKIGTGIKQSEISIFLICEDEYIFPVRVRL